jgi:hypothetical protein
LYLACGVTWRGKTMQQVFSAKRLYFAEGFSFSSVSCGSGRRV